MPLYHLEVKKRPFYHNQNKTMYSLEKAVSDGSKPEEVTTMTMTDLMRFN